MTIHWSDPAARQHLIERVGPDEYDRLHAEQKARSTVAIVPQQTAGSAHRSNRPHHRHHHDAHGRP